MRALSSGAPEVVRPDAVYDPGVRPPVDSRVVHHQDCDCPYDHTTDDLARLLDELRGFRYRGPR